MWAVIFAVSTRCWHSPCEAVIVVLTSQAGRLGQRVSVRLSWCRRDPSSFSLFSAHCPLPLARQHPTSVGVQGHLLCDHACPALIVGGLEVTGHCHVHHPLLFSHQSWEVHVNQNYYMCHQCFIKVGPTHRDMCIIAWLSAQSSGL